MKKVTDFQQMKQAKEKIAMVTAYDFPQAKLAEQAEVDLLLVGDSLGMVVLGYDSTVPVTLNDMVHHTKAVKRGANHTFIVADLPFMTYHTSKVEAMKSAAMLMQEGGAHAVKVEGGGEVIETIRALTTAGVPVMGHLGLTPQTAGVLGGYKVQGKTAEAATSLVEEAKKCEEAGAFALVLECIPQQLGQIVTESISIPTIGIGAGSGTDGQVLVLHDLVNFGVDRVAKFVKQYSNVNHTIETGIREYIKDVKQGTFPDDHYSFTMNEAELDLLYGGK
ncbi:3-methyl-2-oxobutanoate hydroxymethyltransferase [Lederbergia galactosidilytica]|uniref:3-methyl-2-oxobutanoate hydroxymethyltransferase n=1 Tax=Lederbergia galactosidilytica TaxID=217031 RepID=A0A177ZP95_9BACI|nr:3-methyl-2-oxobutanoate hydroxymethyltransferase [Lederbergia galactosidilytica]MBP1914611.1 3-methyl-2-oxobutanoate hydroxymethyltransferase [Lederbergia galactosidilytica]OAK69797.1 3-methyl-2-oxobutanoate hydroxymethyltransferase [Lederbergia galactosidilytica]